MGQPIAFGYFMVLNIGILLFLKKLLIIKNIPGYATLILFITALFLTGSRGPWLCCIVMILLFWGLPKINLNIIGIYLFSGILAIGGILAVGKNFFISLDPYGTFSYRIALIQNSLMEIQKNLWFGSADYFSSVELEEMRQGQGIIDIVNSYLQVALHSGVIGLFLFALIFIILIFQIFKCVKRISRKNSPECFYLGILMVGTLIASMLLIGTVSLLPYIKLYCWSFIALGSAYVRFIHAAEKEAVVDCRI
ncbi:MAG: O-antigen ligase family protein [Deltaproteobacteria bacterium]|nr:O-antigen ligase family protein [Deltaproteobacteria bacterium]